MQRFPNYVLNRQFDYGFRLALLKKDMQIASKMSTAGGVHTPLLHFGLDLYGDAAHVLPNTADHVEVAKILEEFAGVTISPSASLPTPKRLAHLSIWTYNTHTHAESLVGVPICSSWG